MKIKYLLLLLFSLFFYKAQSQDANYWSSAYNAAGILSPGSAVAFTKDSGVVYYNPALLAYNTHNTATISSSFYQYNSLNIKNGAGDGFNLKSTSLNSLPFIASGIIALKGKKKFTIGYAFINEPVITYKTSQQRDGKVNVLNDNYSPGPEAFVGQYSAENNTNNITGLLSTGFKIAPNLAFGISAAAQYRTQHLTQDYKARAIINTTSTFGLAPITNQEELYDASHYNVSLKFKAGLAYDKNNHHLGLNISSPLLKLKSSGEILSDNLISNLRLLPTDTINLLATGRQTKLNETWKMPLSIALGYAYDLTWGQIYLCTEYFSSIHEYDIIIPRNDYFIRSEGTENNMFTSDLLKFKDARRSVTNFGFGITYYLKDDVAAYFAGRTDFSYANGALYKDDNGFVSNTSRYNIYHMQVGSSIKKRKFNLRTGLLIDYGHTGSYPQPVNMSNPNESNFLAGDPHNTSANYFSVGVMLAYVHNF